MKKRKATFYLSEEVLKKLTPYKTFKSLLVEVALEYLLEKLTKETFFEILFLNDDSEEIKKRKLKELLSNKETLIGEKSIEKKKENLLSRYEELFE